MAKSLWSWDELVVVLRLYYTIPFGRMDARAHEVINVASQLQRSPNAVALKLVNFAHFDPDLQRRGIKGMSNTSKLDEEVWQHYENKLDLLYAETEAQMPSLTQIENVDTSAYSIQKVRLKQSFFRSVILAAYESKCCITGLSSAELLVASHIKPWASDEANRLNPKNGLCLNVLHDKCFDRGWLSISNDYKILVSPRLQLDSLGNMKNAFIALENATINLPERYSPDPEFLSYHRLNIFQS